MSEEMRFEGFSRQIEKFFADLEKNNEKAWFEARKPFYREAVLATAQAFITELGPMLAKVHPGIRWDTRTNGSGSIFRIYRDVRFSKDKSPYKTHLGVRFWTGESKNAGGGYYFGLSGKDAHFYGGAYGFAKEHLGPYREAVAGRRGARLPKLVTDLVAAGYTVGGEHFKRVPRGYPADHPRADLLRHDGLWVRAPKILKKHSRSRDLLEVCVEHARAMKPLNGWLRKTLEG